MLESFAKTLPHGLGLEVLFEQNRYVQARLDKLLSNLLFGALAVMGVILFMMGWRSHWLSRWGCRCPR